MNCFYMLIYIYLNNYTIYNMKLYGIDIENESENDEDYIPDKDELIKEEK